MDNGETEKIKTQTRLAPETGTSKGNGMVVEEGMEEDKSMVKGMTVETSFPAGIVMCASPGTQPIPEHRQQHVSASWSWL